MQRLAQRSISGHLACLTGKMNKYMNWRNLPILTRRVFGDKAAGTRCYFYPEISTSHSTGGLFFCTPNLNQLFPLMFSTMFLFYISCCSRFPGWRFQWTKPSCSGCFREMRVRKTCMVMTFHCKIFIVIAIQQALPVKRVEKLLVTARMTLWNIFWQVTFFAYC